MIMNKSTLLLAVFATLATLVSRASSAIVVCPNDMAKCNDGTCIPKDWFCDKEKDCPDEEDEEGCDQDDDYPDDYPSDDCDNGYFLCDGYCIPNQYRCNNINDCDDGNDERNCHDGEYDPCDLRCYNDECISESQICNGHDDCLYGEDEFACNFKVHGERVFHCIEECLGLKRPPCNGTKPKTPSPTTTTTTTTKPPKIIRYCPDKMDLVLDRCVSVHVGPPLNWTMAKEWCEYRDNYLVEIDTGDFFVSLTKYLNKTSMSSYSFWIGANDIEEEGEWVWAHSGKMVTLGTPLWKIYKDGDEYVQQPAGGRDENCGILDNCPFQYLNDVDCESSRGYICEHMVYTKKYY